MEELSGVVIVTPNSLYCDFTDIIQDEIDIEYKESCENRSIPVIHK